MTVYYHYCTTDKRYIIGFIRSPNTSRVAIDVACDCKLYCNEGAWIIPGSFEQIYNK